MSTHSSALRYVVVASLGILLSEAAYQAWKYLKSKRLGENSSSSASSCLFFPDNKIACRRHFTQMHGCQIPRCRFSHDAELAYAQLLRHLTSCRSSVDICVFVFTCGDLADVIVDLHSRGVVVRVITDKEQVEASGSQVTRFRSQGIQVRHNETSFLMHHKFAIVDSKKLINGSFNWTRQAISGNCENVLITSDRHIVKSYKQEFEKLWEMYKVQ